MLTLEAQLALLQSTTADLVTQAAGAGSPVILQENRDAEVTDLLAQPNGDLFASIVFSSTSGEAPVTIASGKSR